MLVPLAGGGLGAYPVVRPVGTTTPTVAAQTEIWDANLSTRVPLGFLRNAVMNAPWMGNDAAGSYNTSTLGGVPISFSVFATADAGGVVAATAFLSSPGALLKWKIEFIAVGSVGSAVSPRVTISDGVGDVPLNCPVYWGRKQATAATALTFSATGLTALATITIIGQARGIT